MAVLVNRRVDSESITKFGWETKIRSIQDADLPWMWVGSLIICCYPNWELITSILESSKVVVSLVCQILDFALKPLMVTSKTGMVDEKASKVSPKLYQQPSKSSLDWFEELHKEKIT